MRLRTQGVVVDIFWNFFQRGGSLLISFISNMVLARLLTPDDFGCVGIILIFVSIADLFIDSGLGAALIQKKDVVQKDYNTVYTVNFAISLFLYTLIFISAPFFARFFVVQDLDVYLRVVSVSILIRAFFVVQSADLLKNFRYKELSISGIIATASSVLIAIIMAWKGFGVWSLVAKNIVQPLVMCILYRICSHIHTQFGFDRDSFKELFGFGWFVMLTSLIDVVYSNSVSLIVGKRYTVKELGYYNQASSLQQIPSYSLAMVINQVLFPHMSKIHDNKELMRSYSQRVMIVATFVIFPIMIYLISFAKPLVVLLYSAKWLPAAIFFQILCIEGIVHSLIHINRQILKALGETKLLFRIQVVIFIVGIIFLLIAQTFSIVALTWSLVFCSFVNWILLAFITGKRIGYSIRNQISDMASSLIISVLTMLMVNVLIKNWNLSPISTLLISGIFFLVAYCAFSFLLKTKGFKMTYALCFNSVN